MPGEVRSYAGISNQPAKGGDYPLDRGVIPLIRKAGNYSPTCPISTETFTIQPRWYNPSRSPAISLRAWIRDSPHECGDHGFPFNLISRDWLYSRGVLIPLGQPIRIISIISGTIGSGNLNSLMRSVMCIDRHAKAVLGSGPGGKGLLEIVEADDICEVDIDGAWGRVGRWCSSYGDEDTADATVVVSV